MVIGYKSTWTITTGHSTQLIHTDLQIQAQVKYTLLNTLLQKYAYHFWEKKRTLPLVISQKKMENQLSVYAHQLVYNHYQSKMKEKVSTVEFTQSYIC